MIETFEAENAALETENTVLETQREGRESDLEQSVGKRLGCHD